MAGKPNRGQQRSFGPHQIGQRFRDYLAETVLISIVFYLVLFGLLLLTDVTVPTPELVFIALVPFLVLLISSGRIQELRFGDLSMKFQQAVQGMISHDIAGESFEYESTDPMAKGGDSNLQQMIENQGSTLSFTIGRRYDPKYIQQYLRQNLEENPNFRYVLFNDRNGRFSGLMKAVDFVSYVWLHRDESGVVAAIESGDILDDENVIKTRIQEGSTLGEAREKMEAVDRDILAVVDTDDEFVGVLTREDVTSKLLGRLMGHREGQSA